MLLPRATLFTIGALVAAVVGWGALILSTSAHTDAEAEWADQRTALEAQLADLSTTGDRLSAELAQLTETSEALDATLAEERAAAGDLAAIRADIDTANAKLSDRLEILGEREHQIAEAVGALAVLQVQLGDLEGRIGTAKASLNRRLAILGEREHDLAAVRSDRERLDHQITTAEARLATLTGRLNQRMTALGKRDRDLAEADRALAVVKGQIADQRQRFAAATERLNRRMVMLGERERTVVEIERALQVAQLELARLNDRATGTKAALVESRTAVARTGVDFADGERRLASQGRALERAEAQLARTTAELEGVVGRLDHALLAQDVATLSADRATLTDDVAALNRQIDERGPLAESAITLNTRVAELEREVLDLSRLRTEAAAALRVTRAEFEQAESDRQLVADAYAELVAVVGDLEARKATIETEVARLDAEVRHQETVFATLELLKHEQGFLRDLIGTMIEEGTSARTRILDLREEGRELLVQQMAAEKALISKQAEVEVLDKAILAKSHRLEDEPKVSSARAF